MSRATVAFDLVIFDCDGVLIDSETLAIRSVVAGLAEEAIAVTFEEIADRYTGLSMAPMLADLEHRHERPLSDDFAARHRARVAAAFEVELRAIPGVEAVIDSLSCKRCVASSSSPRRLRHSLELAGLYGRFYPHIFSSTMVARGKPAPDLFLYAAAQMNSDPARCVVIEDSEPGVAGAVAAGMTVIGFTGGSHCPPGHDAKLRAAGAALAIGRMADFPMAVLRLG